MSFIKITGGKHLRGEIKVQGSKNAVLPIIAATVLNKGITKIKNCPKILDVLSMIKILEKIGCFIEWEKDTLIVNATDINSVEIPEKYVGRIRSSIIMLGSVLGRCKEVTISYPGGCSIGSRPIDLHIKALKKMNIEITEEGGFLNCTSKKIIGADIVLDFPSVGATENIILTAVLSEGITYICNAAKEPEIVELCQFLQGMGANIRGAGTDKIIIEGVKELHDTEFTISADRIVAGTYMAAVATSKGNVTLNNIDCSQISAITSILKDIGCKIECGNSYITIESNKRLDCVDVIRTQPYPGFPTDMQSQMMSVLSLCDGTSVILENIFETRYNNARELCKMGADIIIEGKLAVIKGVERLSGAEVYSNDLRGGAGLIIAGLAAKGMTVVHNTEYVERGYEDICRDLRQIGASIEMIP